MTTATQSNILKKDADGNWYSVPAKEEQSFIQAVEAIILADFMSVEWYEASHDFQNQFGIYAK